MRIEKVALAVEPDQMIETNEYAKPLCVETVDATPMLFLCVEPDLPRRTLRVRIVQQGMGPTPQPEFGKAPECLAFRYVGSCFLPNRAWHVFVEV